MEDQKPAKRQYTKRRMTLNEKVASFRLKSDPSHRRVVHCYQVDDVSSQNLWCVHYRVLVPGKRYVRTMSEWFEKALWDYVYPPDTKKAIKFRPPRIGKPVVDKPLLPLDDDGNEIPEKPKTALEAAMERLEALEKKLEEKEAVAEKPKPKAPRPRITFEEEEPARTPVVRVRDETPSEEEDEVTVSVNPITNLRVVRKKGQETPNDEMKKNGKSVEYNRFAHKEMALGKPEDLAMFESHVQSNAALNIGRAKLQMQRHKRDLLAQLERGNLGSGAGFTPDGTDA